MTAFALFASPGGLRVRDGSRFCLFPGTIHIAFRIEAENTLCRARLVFRRASLLDEWFRDGPPALMIVDDPGRSPRGGSIRDWPRYAPRTSRQRGYSCSRLELALIAGTISVPPRILQYDVADSRDEVCVFRLIRILTCCWGARTGLVSAYRLPAFRRSLLDWMRKDGDTVAGGGTATFYTQSR